MIELPIASKAVRFRCRPVAELPLRSLLGHRHGEFGASLAVELQARQGWPRGSPYLRSIEAVTMQF
jgi:hypothetical protein